MLPASPDKAYVDWYNCSSAHSRPLNANQKAYAAWWLWARLGGWDGAGGDINGDGRVNLQDAILALQILSGFSLSGIQIGADVSGNQVIGVEEVVYILQKQGLVR